MPNVYVDPALERQTAKLKDVSTKYECDKRFWIASIIELERKIKVNYTYFSTNYRNILDRPAYTSRRLFHIH